MNVANIMFLTPFLIVFSAHVYAIDCIENMRVHFKYSQFLYIINENVYIIAIFLILSPFGC